MARIPDNTQITRAIPVGRQSITQAANPTKLLEARANVAVGYQGVLDEQDKYTAAKAKTRFLIEKKKLDEKLENAKDDELAKAEEEYSSGLEELRGQLRQDISNPRRREEFDLDTELTATDGKVAARKFIKDRITKRELTGLDVDLESLGEEVARGKVKFSEGIAAVRDRLDTALGMGFLTDREQVAKAYNKWAEDTAKLMIESAAPEARLEMLKEPWAENLDPDYVRKVMEDSKEETHDEEAQLLAEELLSRLQAGADETELAREIDKHPEPEVREKARTKFFVGIEREKKLEMQRVDRVFDEHYEDILAGRKKVKDIPRADLDVVKRHAGSIAALYKAENDSETMDRPYPKWSDPDVIDELEKRFNRHGPQSASDARAYFNENRGKLSASDYASWSHKTNKALGKATEELGTIEGLWTANEEINRRVDDYYPDQDTNKGNKRDAKLAKRYLKGVLSKWFFEQQKLHPEGKKPSDADIVQKLEELANPRKIMDRKWINEIEEHPSFIADMRVKKVFESTSGVVDRWQAIVDNDPEWYRKFKEHMKNQVGEDGRPIQITKQMVVENYLATKAKKWP